MDQVLNILAAGWLEGLGAVIFVLFWVVSTIVGQIAKKKEEAERQRRAEDFEREQRMGGNRDQGALPPVLPPVGENRPPVTTRDELERRLAEARRRREEAARRQGEMARPQPDGPWQQPESARRETADTIVRRQAEEARQRGQRDAQMSNRPAPPPLPRQQQDSVFEGSFEVEQERIEVERKRRELAAKAEAKRREQEKRRKIEAREDQSAAARKKRESERESVLTPQAPPSLLAALSAATPQAPSGPTDRTPGTVSADAATIRKWLTPATLRSQYILTELLSPPVAMRPEREW